MRYPSILEAGEMKFSPWDEFPEAMKERTNCDETHHWREVWSLDSIEDGAGNVQTFNAWDEIPGTRKEHPVADSAA
jgi:hypothetical protein